MNKSVNFKKISVHGAPERSPGFLLWHISTTWRSSIEATLKLMGLTHPQFVILASLGWLTRNQESITQAAIGKMAGLDPNTTSQILKGLEQKSLIRRGSSADARAKNPLLTAKGKEVLTRALPAVEAADALFFNSLTGAEMKSLLQLFHKLSSAFNLDSGPNDS
jgi:DNA-binding MarR family transcriptional regulator